MRTYLDCLPCLMGQALKAARAVTDDEEIQRQVVNAIAAMIPELSLGLKPPEIAQRGYRLIGEITGNNLAFFLLLRLQTQITLTGRTTNNIHQILLHTNQLPHIHHDLKNLSTPEIKRTFPTKIRIINKRPLILTRFFPLLYMLNIIFHL